MQTQIPNSIQIKIEKILKPTQDCDEQYRQQTLHPHANKDIPMTRTHNKETNAYTMRNSPGNGTTNKRMNRMMRCSVNGREHEK